MIEAHEWTNGGDEVLIVRCIPKDGKTSNLRLKDGDEIAAEPFQNPLVVGETVTAPDWDSRQVCGGGIHGWAWGLCIGEGKDPDWSAIWKVYGAKPEDVVPIEGKVKFRTGILRFSGAWWEATSFVLSGQIALVHKRSSGSASSTGESGSASAPGKSSTAIVVGVNGKAQAGEFGCVALAWWNEKESRSEMRCALTGRG